MSTILTVCCVRLASQTWRTACVGRQSVISCPAMANRCAIPARGQRWEVTTRESLKEPLPKTPQTQPYVSSHRSRWVLGSGLCQHILTYWLQYALACIKLKIYAFWDSYISIFYFKCQIHETEIECHVGLGLTFPTLVLLLFWHYVKTDINPLLIYFRSKVIWFWRPVKLDRHHDYV